MCNEQTSLNYHATVENQGEISALKRRLHDKEMLIDEMDRRLRYLEDEVRNVKVSLSRKRFDE